MRTSNMRSVLVLSLLAACGGDDGHDDAAVDCSTVQGADVFVVGLSKAGTAGTYTFALMSATPAPPARGDNTWTVKITEGTSSYPVDNAQIVVTPFMPAHQHGSPIEAMVTPVTGAAGEYELSPVNLWMPGVWETTIQATGTSGTDSAVFKFCIP